MTGCRGRLDWHAVEMMLAAGATLTCRCGHVIRGMPKVPARCPRCGADLKSAVFCWEIIIPEREGA
jgi:predicted Zn-ribbon and HTH transcriptional regulator